MQRAKGRSKTQFGGAVTVGLHRTGCTVGNGQSRRGVAVGSLPVETSAVRLARGTQDAKPLLTARLAMKVDADNDRFGQAWRDHRADAKLRPLVSGLAASSDVTAAPW